MRWSIGNFPMRAPRNRVLIWFHSSSASRVTAGAAGFLTFIQSPRGHLDRVTQPLRYNTLGAKRACVPVNDRPVAAAMLVEGYAVGRPAQQLCQSGLALLDRHPAQILLVKLDQVERARNHVLAVPAVSD
jgi:hypothetical protein